MTPDKQGAITRAIEALEIYKDDARHPNAQQALAANKIQEMGE